jgi:DNA-binding CsgD family transcriptional regulator/Flp pilus assembly protein TadD
LFSLLFTPSLAQNLTPIDSLLHLVESSSSDTSKIRLYNQLAMVMLEKDLDSALQWTEKAALESEKQKFQQGIFESYETMGIVWTEKGNHDKAIESFINAIKYKEKHLPTVSLINVYRQMAIVFMHQKEYERAEGYYEEALKSAENEKSDLVYSIYFNIATLASKIKNFEKAELYFDKALQNPKISNLEKGSVYQNRGNMYQRMKKLDEAKESYTSALQLFSENDKSELAKTYNSLTDVALKTGDYPLAEIHGKKAADYALQVQDMRSAIYAYRNLGYSFYLRKDYQNAFEIQELGRKLKDSLYLQTNTQVLNELDEKYQNEKKKRQIEKLQQEKELSEERQKTVALRNYSIIALTIILVIVLFLLLQIQKIRHQRKIAQQEIEKQIQQTILAEKESKIKQYNEQLHRHTNNLLQKNQILSELREQLNALKDAEDEQEKLKKQNIQELINSRILTDEDWHNYKQTFHQVYPTFFETIQQNYTSISKAEIRIATLLKLGLSNYEMATILGISEESARKGKYRLRQRMEVDSEDKVIEILSKLE